MLRYALKFLAAAPVALVSIPQTTRAQSDPVYTQIVGGLGHTCGLASDGRVFCWGTNQGGQLGAPDRSPCTYKDKQCERPVEVALGDVRLKALAAGHVHTCGLTEDGLVYCWGMNHLRQLGQPALGTACVEGIECARTPMLVNTPLRFASLSSGAGHTCGLTASGEAWCWGMNDHGQIGTSTESCTASDKVSVPCRAEARRVEGLPGMAALAGGYKVTCGLATDQRTWCWGELVSFQGRSQEGEPPTPDEKIPPAAQIALGTWKGCALEADGTAWCWGAWYSSPGGYWYVNPTRMPVLKFTTIALGEWHGCGLVEDGTAYCWGRNQEAQLGIGTKTAWKTLFPVGPDGKFGVPEAVETNLRFVALGSGGYHSCGLTAAGEAWCWGYGKEGELGNGKSSNSSRPVKVVSPVSFVAQVP